VVSFIKNMIMLPFLVVLVVTMGLGFQYANPIASAIEIDQSSDTSESRSQESLESQPEEEFDKSDVSGNGTNETSDTTTNKNSISKAIGAMKQPGQEAATGVGDDQIGGVETPPKMPRPEVIHLRIQVDSIRVYSDRDNGRTNDGEFHLLGLVTCCGGAVNSVVPAVAYPFKVPGQPDGEIDTPTNQMNDVRGTYQGSWGTVSNVKFKDLYIDVDVDNTNPRTEVRIDFFGMEDDRSSGKLPALATAVAAVGTAIGNPYVVATGAAIALIDKLAQGADAQYLGNVQKVFSKSNNYGVGFHYDSSSLVYKNISYKNKETAYLCEPIPPRNYPVTCVKNTDWPDFPEYIINYRIMDLDQRCVAGWTYDYIDNICRAQVIN
jgi:hypothetical protein